MIILVFPVGISGGGKGVSRFLYRVVRFVYFCLVIIHQFLNSSEFSLRAPFDNSFFFPAAEVIM